MDSFEYLLVNAIGRCNGEHVEMFNEISRFFILLQPKIF